MRRVNTSVGIFCILASFISTLAHAGGFSAGNGAIPVNDTRMTSNRPWGNIGAPKPAPIYQPPPPLPNGYYIGSAPGTGWYAAPLPVNSVATVDLPKVEVEVAGSMFYEQQNIVYTVHVVSNGNIKSLNPEMARVEGAALELLDGPLVSTRTDTGTGKQQIVNTYRYKLMPLRSGEIFIPAIRFAGTHAQDRQLQRGPGSPAAAPAGSFDIAADAALTLEVLPAEPDVNPWLPLKSLRLDARLSQEGPAKAGQPVTLTLQVNAVGALGNQLPSLAQQLESTRYRIYRDATEIKNTFSADGKQVAGSRKETYTIIPLEDGWIRLPDAGLAWWNVDTHRAGRAGLPFGQTGITAAANREAVQSAAGQALFPAYFWVPMIVAVCLLAGFWLGAWQPTRRLFSSAVAWLSTAGHGALQLLQRAGIKLSPLGFVRRIRVGLALFLPRSFKLWMCTRCLHAEDDPGAWCAEFKSRICEHLDIPAHSPLSRIAEKIIAANPQADPARLRELVHTLDGAIYGGSSLDFPAWKQALMQQMRPHPLRRRPLRARRKRAVLPALNPHTA